VRLDAPQILALIESAIERDGVARAWQETIEPALRAVGRKWNETGGRYVEVEHLLSWCVTAALHRVRPPRHREDGIARRQVLLACAPDEWHSLPLEVLHATLIESGMTSCVMLGAAVPPEALRKAVRRLEPRLTIVWSQVPATASPSNLPPPPESARCRVVAAGPGWSATRHGRGPVLSSLGAAIDACRT
jgi:methanogenic corrinoid protein MtbC1